MRHLLSPGLLTGLDWRALIDAELTHDAPAACREVEHMWRVPAEPGDIKSAED